jgi:hypothetical protein
MTTKSDMKKETIIAKEIDDRYTRIMEKMMDDGTWSDEANERFDQMYAGFSIRWGKYL